jgi:tetratricopeptide (TPR) repeat protein
MRTTAVGLALIAVIAAGCATGGTPSSSPSGGQGTEPVPKPSASDPRAREERARELLAAGRAAIASGDPAALPAAARSFREALRHQPDVFEAREQLGLVLYMMGDLDGAVDELRALLRQHPDVVRARLTLATALTAKQDWAAARPELEEVLRRQPDSIQALYGLAQVRYARGDQNGAIEAYRQVLARSPDQADARYNLALVLKLSHRDAEATPEFIAAASAGHARAQYFAGTAYARGLGVERDFSRAIAWWSRAAAQGNTEANTALGELRQTALGKIRRSTIERGAAEQAFRDYRAALWNEFPELTRAGDDDTVGAALLRLSRGAEAVPILIAEARAFSEPAHTLLEDLYQRGVPGQVPAYDPRILDYFKTAADEGQVRARQFLQEISAASEAVPPSPVRP